MELSSEYKNFQLKKSFYSGNKKFLKACNYVEQVLNSIFLPKDLRQGHISLFTIEVFGRSQKKILSNNRLIP